MSEVIVTINLNASCSYVSKYDLDDHLQEIATDIKHYAENLRHEDWYRKIQVDYETQEAVDLTITATALTVT